MKSKALYLFIVCFCVLASFSRAQDTLRPDEVIIVKDFEPRIALSQKIAEAPQVIDSIPPVKNNPTFDFYDKLIALQYEPSPIKPAKMKGEPLSQLYRGYAKLGGGVYGTALGDVYLHNLRSKTATYGFGYNHLSSLGAIKDVARSAFSENRINAHGKRIFFNKILSGSLDYERNVNHFYGFNPDTIPLDIDSLKLGNEDIQQVYNTVGATVNFKSFFKDSNLLNFDLNLSSRLTTSRFNVQEQNLKLDFVLDRYLNTDFVQLKGFYDFNSVSLAGQQYQNHLATISPSITFGSNMWQLKLGLTALAEFDSSSNYFVLPDIYARYNLVGNILIPYLKLTGNVERNNIYSLSRQNPFINTLPVVNNAVTRYQLSAGMRGQFSKSSGFDLFVDHKLVTDLPLFINDFAAYVPNQFIAVYDELVITTYQGALSFKVDDKFDLQFTGQYFGYDVKNELAAWHLPEIKASAFGFYQLNHKIIARAELFFVGSRLAKSFDPAEGESLNMGVYARKLDGFFDASLGFEYRYTPQWSFWLDLNNIAAMRYEIWNYYPSQRFMALGGISWSFLPQK